METGANKDQSPVLLTALDGSVDLPPGRRPLWAFDDGHGVRWLRTTEKRDALLEAGWHPWTGPSDERHQEKAAWLSEVLKEESEGEATWMSDGTSALVPEPLRHQASDADWLELETGLRHLGPDSETISGTPYSVVHAPDHATRKALLGAAPRLVFRHPRAVLAEGFLRDERGKERTAMAVHLGQGAVDLVLVSPSGLQSSVRHPITAAEDAVYRTVHLLHVLGGDKDVAIQLSGRIKPMGPEHRLFRRHFGQVDVHYGRFIPAMGGVSGLHRQHFLPVVQLIQCA